jgi:hypothetical protein
MNVVSSVVSENEQATSRRASIADRNVSQKVYQRYDTQYLKTHQRPFWEMISLLRNEIS